MEKEIKSLLEILNLVIENQKLIMLELGLLKEKVSLKTHQKERMCNNKIKSHDYEKEYSTYIPQGYILINGYWVLK